MHSDDLKRMALLALEEVARQAREEPVPRTRLLRFALAWLHRAAGGGERWPFDDFWKAATAEAPAHSTAAGAAIGRSQTTNACLNAIYRAVGVERTSEMERS